MHDAARHIEGRPGGPGSPADEQPPTPLRLRRDDLHWRRIDDEVVALEARASLYLTTNPAGALLWRALAAGSTRDQLADELATTYGIDRTRALTDTDRFLADLADHGLLER
jgi:Coenzyme PQQ synthesis protein D (PqqD)